MRSPMTLLVVLFHKCCVGSRTASKSAFICLLPQNSGLEEANHWVSHHLSVFEKNERSHMMEPPFTFHQFGNTDSDIGRAELAESENPRGGAYPSAADTNLPKNIVSVAVDLNDLPANKEANSFRDVVYTNRYFTHRYQVHCENSVKRTSHSKDAP